MSKFVEDLSKLRSMHPRAARARKRLLLDHLGHLNMSIRTARELGLPVEALENQASHVRQEIAVLEQFDGARIEPRKRPPVSPVSSTRKPDKYTLFLDECGHPHLSPNSDPFPVFVLCGVIILDSQLDTFQRLWSEWKGVHLGDAAYAIHEPKVRLRQKPFYRADPTEMKMLLASLDSVIAELPFHIVAAAIDKDSMYRQFGVGPVDDFLPQSAYLMCVDFVVERFAHFLQDYGNDARGTVVAESRGHRPDAEIQREFVRLHLEGTQFLHESWFHRHLTPHVRFCPKTDQIAGLQIADLAARPLAERVKSPDSDPERWDVFREKFYDGGKGMPMSYGFKVFPTPEHDVLALLG